MMQYGITYQELRTAVQAVGLARINSRAQGR
jgi:hypothetical protein